MNLEAHQIITGRFAQTSMSPKRNIFREVVFLGVILSALLAYASPDPKRGKSTHV